ncbi:hypothetical protein TNCV_4823231 [Trichonephila clavipes]|nr:hypothetical protein TNCV_4823231 [Trichonephila clavipes]
MIRIMILLRLSREQDEAPTAAEALVPEPVGTRLKKSLCSHLERPLTLQHLVNGGAIVLADIMLSWCTEILDVFKKILEL